MPWALWILIKSLIVITGVLLCVAYATLAERRVAGFIQLRAGPNRAGKFGLLQPFADVLKLILKEAFAPPHVDKWVYLLAPIIVLSPALLIFAVIPFDSNFVVADSNVAILFILSVSSISVYGILMASYASNNKYASLGGLRAAAQIISYEVPLGLALIAVLLLTRSLSLVEIVQAQSRWGVWLIFLQPLGFLIFLISAIAESNRVPFDLPEAEGEISGGYNVEYGGIKFALFFLAEYAHLIAIASIVTLVYLGGWNAPFTSFKFLEFLTYIPGFFWFFIKVVFIVFFFIWLRWTVPRVTYWQLMDLGWKSLVPLALLNILITAIGILLWFNFLKDSISKYLQPLLF